MPEFKIHTIESAPKSARGALEVANQKFGFVPNLLGELAAAPAAAKAYVTLSGLLEEASFSPLEVNLMLAAASVANECEYCVAAHSGGLKQAGLADDQIEAVREARALDDPKLEALRAFTASVVETRGHPNEREIEAFLDAGFTKEQILEVLVAVAMKTLSNYTNHIANTPLDKQLEAFAWEPATR